MSLTLQKNVTHLTDKEMDRRDFIKHVGIGFLALTGVAAIIKTIGTMGGNEAQTIGYGSGAYGGSVSPERKNRS